MSKPMMMIRALPPLLFVLAGCGRPDGEARAAPTDAGRIVPVVATAVARSDVPIYLDGLGNVSAFKTVSVRSQVDGRLEKVLFVEGQAVKPGDVLAQVDERPFLIQLEQAEGALARDSAQLRDNQINLERYVVLCEKKLVAQQQVDDQRALVGQSEGAIKMDRAQVASARLNLDYARIRSPIDGISGVRQVDPGNLVHANDANGIVVITQVRPIAVLFTLPQDDLHRVAAALQRGPLVVEAWSRDGETKLDTGQLSLIDNQINVATATMRLKAVFPNAQGLLWPNQFVKARLLVSVRKGVLTVPAATVQRGPNGLFAYVIGADRKVSARPVQVETTQGEVALIRDGLKEGEEVVVDGQAQLKPGSTVSARASEKKAGP